MQGANAVTKGIKPVILDKEKCNGCVSCMKRCPTEAIRISAEGKATIMYERCVGCGVCVKVCPTHAKHENYDALKTIENYKYKIALPSPSIYGQFNNLTDVNYILTGLKKMGFDEVFEVGVGAELVSAATRKYIAENKTKPLISSSCPAILNLILMRYEHLVDHLSPLLAPEVISAKLALKRALDKGLKRSEIGIFSIAPCAAMVAELKKYPALVDGVLAFKEVYFPLLAEMNKLQSVEKLSRVGKLGLSWGSSTGEAVGINTINFISADGMENVFNVLNELEHDKLNSIDFLEFNACPSGCVGGTMNIENPFLARARLRQLRSLTDGETGKDYKIDDLTEFLKREPYMQNNVFKLDEDRLTAMKKLMRVNDIYSKLPKFDCGSCGAPRCMAFAEDYVLGNKRKCKYCEVDFDEYE